MFKEILRGILGGTAGMLVIGIFSGQWLLGITLCYSISISASIARYKKNNCKK